MIKLAIFILVIAAIWFYRRNHKLLQQSQRRSSRQAGTETTMVRCEQCQLYLPPANAVQKSGRWYCQQHR